MILLYLPSYIINLSKICRLLSLSLFFWTQSRPKPTDRTPLQTQNIKMLINSGYSVIIADVLTLSDAHGCLEELFTIPATLRDRTLIILSLC